MFFVPLCEGNSRLSVLTVDESVLDSPNDVRERSETAPPDTSERHERTERAMECEKEGSPCSVSSQDLAQVLHKCVVTLYIVS